MKCGSVIKRPTGSTTSGHKDGTCEQMSTTSGQASTKSTASGKTSTVNHQTSSASYE